MMATLAIAPFLRFLALRASFERLERTGAYAALMLALFLVLPLALRLGRRAMRR